MIEILQESQGNMLAIKGRGTLTDLDYEQLLIPTLERIMRDHDKARLLFDMGNNFKGWNMGAAWRYAKFGFRHKDDFEKVAAVCGPKWVQWAMKLKSFFVPAEIRTFSCRDRSEAFDWIKA